MLMSTRVMSGRMFIKLLRLALGNDINRGHPTGKELDSSDY